MTLIPGLRGQILLEDNHVEATRLPGLLIVGKPWNSSTVRVQNMSLQNCATAPTLCDGSRKCKAKAVFPPEATNTPVALLYRADRSKHPVDQGYIQMAGIDVYDYLDRPWLQIHAGPRNCTWQDVVIEGQVVDSSNTSNCAVARTGSVEASVLVNVTCGHAEPVRSPVVRLAASGAAMFVAAVEEEKVPRLRSDDAAAAARCPAAWTAACPDLPCTPLAAPAPRRELMAWGGGGVNSGQNYTGVTTLFCGAEPAIVCAAHRR
jgi:hypothetical protein